MEETRDSRKAGQARTRLRLRVKQVGLLAALETGTTKAVVATGGAFQLPSILCERCARFGGT